MRCVTLNNSRIHQLKLSPVDVFPVINRDTPKERKNIPEEGNLLARLQYYFLYYLYSTHFQIYICIGNDTKFLDGHILNKTL